MDRINRIYRIELEESLDVGDFNWRAVIPEIIMYPTFLRLACRDKSLGAAEAKALNGANKSLLPTMISAADWIVAALRHPMDVSAPKGSPPKARLP